MPFGRGFGRGRGRHHHEHHDHDEEGYGPVGNCVCIKCGYTKPHTPGVPCRDEKCPNCGIRLVREGSYHHQQFLNRKKEKND